MPEQRSTQIQEGWETATLFSVAAPKPFSIVDGPFGTQLHANEYTEEGIPLIRITNLSYEGRFKHFDMKYVTEKTAERLKRSEVFPDDLIIAKTGATIGKAALFPNEFAKGLIASSCLKISFDRNKINPKLFLYLINSPRGQSNIINGAGGSTRTTINIRPFGTIQFSFPKLLAEQSKIAEVLSAIDDVIGKTEALIAKLIRVKEGLMHDLLTRGIDEKGRIRTEKTHKFKDSPVGRIPEEWDTKTLNDLISPARPIVYGILMPGYGYEGGIPVIKVKDINDGLINQSDLLLTSPGIDQEYRRSRVRAGDLLFSIRGTIGRTAFVPKALNKANITQDTARIGIVKGDARFVRAYLEMPEPHRFIQIHSLGVAVQGINLRDVRRIPVAFPSSTEQRVIGDAIEIAERRISSEKWLMTKLESIKRGLMEDLLTGKVRVNRLLKQ
jgi:type I restriction enzyme, S subunit